MNKPELVHWTDHLGWSRVPQLDSLLTTPLVREAILGHPVPGKPPEGDSQLSGLGKPIRRTAQLSSRTAQIDDSQNHKQIKLLF